MTERGTVLSVAGDSATIECAADESCASCSSLLCNPRTRSLVAIVGSFGVHPGDRVDVAFGERAVGVKAGLLFLFPIAGFAALYLALGDSGESLRVAAGIGGLVTGLAGALGVSRLFPDETPRVVHVYSPAETAYPYVSQNDSTT